MPLRRIDDRGTDMEAPAYLQDMAISKDAGTMAIRIQFLGRPVNAVVNTGEAS